MPTHASPARAKTSTTAATIRAPSTVSSARFLPSVPSDAESAKRANSTNTAPATSNTARIYQAVAPLANPAETGDRSEGCASAPLAVNTAPAMSGSERATVHCPHEPDCPGCPLIRLPYEEQLDVKHRLVETTARRFPELLHVPVTATVAADPTTGYRARGKLAVSGTHVGLFAAGSHRVVDLPECRVLAPELAAVSNAIRRALPLGIPLRAVDLRKVDTGVLVTLVVAEGTDEARVHEAAQKIQDLARSVVGIAVAYREETSAQVLGRAPRTVLGEARVRCQSEPGSPWHYAAPGTFAQAHAGQERALVEAISSHLEKLRSGGAVRVLDLFSGVGVLSLELAARGHEVLSVEAFAPSSALCEAAARAQDLSVTVEAGNAAAVLHRAVTEGERFDAVVVNPPRRGLSPELRADLGRLAPELSIYVSCEPRSLARDLADLSRKGLATMLLSPHDMMPLSAEVETLAVMSRGAVPRPVVLHRAETFIAVDKPPHEPTTAREHEGSLLARVRKVAGFEEAVPVHRLDLGTSGVCLFARRPGETDEIASLLSDAKKEYVVLVRGIAREKGTVRRSLVEHGRAHDARTRYVRRKLIGGHSLVLARPEQGKKHQIRRHLSSIGHPVIGDERHGHAPTNQFFAMRHLLDRPFLHCSRIAWTNGDERIDISSPLPADLAIVLESLAGVRSAPEGH